MAVVKRTALPCRTHYNGPSFKGVWMRPVQILSDTGKGSRYKAGLMLATQTNPKPREDTSKLHKC